MDDLNEDEMLAELGVSVKRKPARARTPREERIIAGFEDIVKFFEQHGRPPGHGDERDIFERLYAVRLDRLREQDDCQELLRDLDTHGMLAGATEGTDVDELDDEAMLAELGVATPAEGDLTNLKHVQSREERRAAEEIANRSVCSDFAKFKPLFDQVRKDIAAGVRSTRPFQTMAEIKQGEYFIVGGQIAYVAELKGEFVTDYDRRDSRLRVIYDNGTESDILLRSLQRALHRDEAGRRITNPSAGPLFGSETDDDDLEAGTIYVLRSKSDHPTVAAHRELIHKIGVTGGSVEARIASAAVDATYLLAGVDVVATYKLYNINRTKLENLLHRVFGSARLDLTIMDRFGNPVQPREWFLVPLSAIDEAVARVRDQSILDYEYDPAMARLKSFSN